MDTFLKELATYYYNTYQTKITDFCFVFPGRRACLFFKEHLKKMVSEPIWAPKTLTINEFIQDFSTIPVADKLTLVFELYQVYEDIYKTGVSFDDFLPWGEIILNDFDDIDKYRADAKQVYTNLLAIKEIEDDYSFLSEDQIKVIKSFWASFNPNKLSEHQTDFVKIWEKLDDVYEEFNKRLRLKNICYEGQIYKTIANNIDNKEPLNIKHPKIIFVAFNALNRCEEKLFHHLRITDKADFIWDYTPWLLNANQIKKSMHETPTRAEAVHFMEDNLINFPAPSNWKFPENKTLPNIEITSVASSTTQTQVINQFLKNIDSDSFDSKNNIKATETAVILTDENMLLPVLHGIPKEEKSINITMGYPMKNTPAYGLIELIFELQKNCRKTKQGKTWFYFRNVLPILTHQYLEPLDSKTHQKLAKDIVSKNKTYIEASELQCTHLLTSIFKYIDSSENLSEYLNHILFTVYQSFKTLTAVDTSIEKEFIYQSYLLVNHISDLLKNLSISIKNDTWIKLYKRSAEMQSIPFSGEPLKGLQVMGILETRALDFENLVVLNMNEGVFPQTGATNSLIPYVLRNAFNLPTIEHQDAIFAYYFYRLIHRAKNVRLLYNSAAQGMQSGEMSRFLFQLKYEYPRDKLKFSTVSEDLNISNTPTFFVEKDEKVMNTLSAYLLPNTKKLSPSALSTYFECPMRFYYKYVTKAHEPDEVTEDIDPRIFGTLFHEAIEKLYLNLLNQEIKSEHIDLILKDKKKIDAILHESFEEYFTHTIDNSDFKDIQGQNVLIFDIIKKYIIQFLKAEKENAPFTILGLEKVVNAEFKINSSTIVNLGGTIDRLDGKDGSIRVIDYKTGAGDDKFSNIEDLFKQEKHKKLKAIFQTLLYSSILQENEKSPQTYIPGVVWVKKIFTSNDYSLKKGPARGKAETLTLNMVQDEFKDTLYTHLEDLFNANVAFQQTTHIDNCKNCSYANICGK
ncbi:PD-(D/E)XK nuclease family protein [Saccharicrinis aurantiacus]|uniref:PD-(D/E)XK nuclease family protein n=1 Tax=Saccharicrinis aurantiacus TaxID=1849719 RepID=UPI0024908DB8|nr:PD-(D/E)XK nuclease family protein [Saccharicrinis aurantiacus]